jgi:hypothetical protein
LYSKYIRELLKDSTSRGVAWLDLHDEENHLVALLTRHRQGIRKQTKRNRKKQTYQMEEGGRGRTCLSANHRGQAVSGSQEDPLGLISLSSLCRESSSESILGPLGSWPLQILKLVSRSAYKIL